jgi:hypothetical protein
VQLREFVVIRVGCRLVRIYGIKPTGSALPGAASL